MKQIKTCHKNRKTPNLGFSGDLTASHPDRGVSTTQHRAFWPHAKIFLSKFLLFFYSAGYQPHANFFYFIFSILLVLSLSYFSFHWLLVFFRFCFVSHWLSVLLFRSYFVWFSFCFVGYWSHSIDYFLLMVMVVIVSYILVDFILLVCLALLFRCFFGLVFVVVYFIGFFHYWFVFYLVRFIGYCICCWFRSLLFCWFFGLISCGIVLSVVLLNSVKFFCWLYCFFVWFCLVMGCMRYGSFCCCVIPLYGLFWFWVCFFYYGIYLYWLFFLIIYFVNKLFI